MMNDKLDWTGKLGDAFVNQQKDVLSAIQVMRAKAQSAGSLKTTPQQKVIVQDNYIEVEPANPQVVYVPAYSPAVVYEPGYSAGDLFADGAVSFGLGVAMGAAWTGGCNWGGGYVNNVNVNNFYGRHWRNDNWNNNHPWRADPNRRQAARGTAAAGGSPAEDAP